MRKILVFIAIVLALSFISPSIFACTTAVLSGRCTPDARPMLWKHRDTNKEQNRLAFFSEGKYECIGLVNTNDVKGKSIWAGMNSVGFAVMNSASYNLNPEDDKTEKKDREGIVMKAALETCETVDDFENLLEKLPRPMGVEANFGVIDAKGNAAYFEVSNIAYAKIDVTDPRQTPRGYLIRSNYSSTGRKNDGAGYIRYQTAREIFAEALQENDLTPEFLIQKATRCLKHSLMDRDLYVEARELPGDTSRFVAFRDYIPRKSSTSAIVLQGVRPGEDPMVSTIWTVLGFPLTSAALPTWVGAGSEMPQILQGGKDRPAPLCDLSLKLKSICFPVSRGSGPYYLDLPRLVNGDESGILQRIEPLEERLLDKAEPMLDAWRTKGFDPKEAKAFYQWVDGDWFRDLKKATME